jgi:hypothetical protein
LAAELEAVRTTLVQLWRRPSHAKSDLHVFIGPPGEGKTTVLCKWLANAVLVQGRPARVWRLDSQVANTEEAFSVMAKILRVPIERFEPREQPNPEELVFVDLPGLNANDATALKELGRQIGTLPEAEVHLVLNAAYEGHLLLDLGRAFSGLPVTDSPRRGAPWGQTLEFGIRHKLQCRFLELQAKSAWGFRGSQSRENAGKVAAPRNRPSSSARRSPNAWQTIC